jgi:hypothetical protein
MPPVPYVSFGGETAAHHLLDTANVLNYFWHRLHQWYSRGATPILMFNRGDTWVLEPYCAINKVDRYVSELRKPTQKGPLCGWR